MDMIGSMNDNGERKRQASHHDDRDRISKLSNDILISIISRLTMREAIATRILSSRWRCLCTNEYATHLNFPQFNLSNCDGDASLEDILIRSRFRNYINMIDQIVDSHKGPKVKEFRVRMLCMEGATIEKWLVFALSKQVEIIDIHLDHYLMNARTRSVNYSLHLRNLITQLPLGLRSLKKLSLSAIRVEDSEIELLLSNSPQLESLSIAWPGRLTKVSVVGQPMLKHLEICHAIDLDLVEICNMTNLVSLKLHYLAPAFDLALKNVPKLVEFSTYDNTNWAENIVFTRVAHSICSQLHTLKICSMPSGTYAIKFLDMFPKYINVKHLELQKDPVFEIDNWFWRSMAVIRKCPSLEELVIKLSLPWRGNTSCTLFQETGGRWLPKGDLFSSLKKMKISGFVGSSAELYFFIAILDNANYLEELTIEVCDVKEEIRVQATARALQHIRPTIQESTCRLQVI